MESWKKSFNALFIAQLFAIMGFSTSNPILPLFLTDLGVTDPTALNWWTGAINGSSSLVLAIFAPIWGALADNYGRKLMLLRAMVGGVVIMGLLSLAQTPAQVLMLKTLQGCITGTVAAATVLTAAIVPQAEAGYRLGLMQMAVFMGNSLGPLVGGVVRDLANARMAFLVTSVLIGIGAVLVLTRVQEEFVPKKKNSSFFKNAVPDFSAVRQSGMLIALLTVVFFIQFSGAVVGPIIPLIVLHMSKSVAGAGSMSGLIIGVTSLAAALGSIVTGKLSNRLGYGRALLICIGGAFLFYLPQGFATTPWQLVALRALSGFFLGGTMPTVNALIAQNTERDKQGAVFGIASSVTSAGNAIGPAFGAMAASLLGYPAVFFVTTLVLGGLWVGIGRKLLRPRAV